MDALHVSYLAVAISVISILLSFIYLVFGDTIKTAIAGPKLAIEFGKDIDGCVFLGPELILLRLRVTNKGIKLAKGCQAYISDIIDLKTRERLTFDWSRLRWPHLEYTKVDIPRNAVQFIDLVSAGKADQGKLNFLANPKFSQMEYLEHNRRDCELTVSLVSEDGAFFNKTLILYCEGSWKQMHAKLLDKSSRGTFMP